MSCNNKHLFDDVVVKTRPYSATFMDLKSGDRVRYMRTNGIGRNGVEWVEDAGTVIKYLTFPDHVVVTNRNGCGQVVNAANFKSIIKRVS